MHLQRDTIEIGRQEVLIERVLDGDQKASRELIEKYQRLVCHVVFRMVSNATDRDELCQEVFIKVFRQLHTFRAEAQLSTWIGKIAYHTTVNYLRKRKIPLYDDLTPGPSQQGTAGDSRVDSVADQPRDSSEWMEETQQNRAIHAGINQLPPVYRAIITLYHLQDMSYREIGEILELPEGTVKSYLFRGRKQLKTILSQQLAGETL